MTRPLTETIPPPAATWARRLDAGARRTRSSSPRAAPLDCVCEPVAVTARLLAVAVVPLAAVAAAWW